MTELPGVDFQMGLKKGYAFQDNPNGKNINLEHKPSAQAWWPDHQLLKQAQWIFSG